MVSEIFSTAVVSSTMIMCGLALGFILLKIQGE